MGGIVAHDARSLALLSGWPITSKMLVYGGDEDADELEALVSNWVARGRPDTCDVEVIVSFQNGRSSIRTRWRGR